MVRGEAGETLSLDLYRRVRSEILRGLYRPGERIQPAQLAASSSVSLGVAREALVMLSAQDLVKVERNRHYHVPRLSSADVIEHADAQRIAEGAALRLSVTRGDVAWESELLAAHHRMVNEGSPTFAADSRTIWEPAHLAFHSKLISACGNAVLFDICTRLLDRAELFWTGVAHLDRDPVSEHQALLDAALAHDADAAVETLTHHIDGAARAALAHT